MREELEISTKETSELRQATENNAYNISVFSTYLAIKRKTLILTINVCCILVAEMVFQCVSEEHQLTCGIFTNASNVLLLSGNIP